MRKHKVRHPRITLASTASLCAILLSGCTVPAHMRVDTHDHPALEDREVRYRTTYYFRVFDPCQNVTGNPGVDTLYRFRMTGKAHSLFSDVHFESGTLKAAQIDPLGAKVAYDAQTREFSVSPMNSTPQGSPKLPPDDGFSLLKKLLDEYQTTQNETDKKKKIEEIIDRITNELVGGKRLITAKKKAELMRAVQKLAESETAETKEQALQAIRGKLAALPEIPSDCSGRRGFQILGPEGFRTFAQDERLLLAMSSSGKPLITTLEEISNRVLDPATEIELPLVKEKLLLSRIDRALDGYRGDGDPASLEQALENAVKVLEAQQ